MFNLNSHEKVIYVIFLTTRAVGVVVWEAQPGTVDIPFGQAVTIGLDGSVTK